MAKKYWDWRKMFDEMGKSIDGVMVATADHTHALYSCTCIDSWETCLLPEAAYSFGIRITSA